MTPTTTTTITRPSTEPLKITGVDNRLSVNAGKILDVIREVLEKYPNNFNQIVNEVLDRVKTLEPYRSAPNPLRCFICNGGWWSGVYDIPGTYFRVDMGSMYLLLYADRHPQPILSYNETEVKNYFQSLADKYLVGTAIRIPMNEKFPDFFWDTFVAERDFDNYGIASRPPNLPYLEARGPDGRRIFIWPLKRENE